MFNSRPFAILSVFSGIVTVIAFLFGDLMLKQRVVISVILLFLTLVLMLIDIRLQLQKATNEIKGLKAELDKVTRNRNYQVIRADKLQKKLEAFRNQWNVIQTCINAHTLNIKELKFGDIKRVCSDATTIILSVGGFTDDDETE